MTTERVPALTIVRAGEGDGFHGTITYRVFLGDRWVGWVGDGREWRGWRYGGRRWWACWRESGDTAARWNSDLTHPTRRAALADLAAQAGSLTRGTDTVTSAGTPGTGTAIVDTRKVVG